jgi:DNA-binding NarL/FixJ family response regulator
MTAIETPKLSAREIDILQGLVAGRNNREIGRKLGIVERTVKVHASHLYRKLNVENRVQAATWGIRHPEICPPCPMT